MIENGKNYCDRCGREIPLDDSGDYDTLCDRCNAYLDGLMNPRRKAKGKKIRQSVDVIRGF